MDLPTTPTGERAVNFIRGQYGIGDTFGLAWWDVVESSLGTRAPETREAVNAFLEQSDTVDHRLYKGNRLRAIREGMLELSGQP
jgi:hypothetical protein